MDLIKFNRAKIVINLYFIFTIILIGPFSDLAQAASQAPFHLGDMNLDGYCSSQGNSGATVVGATWNCTGKNQPINLNAACVWQYTITDAYASEIRTNDIYSYQCFSNTSGLPTPTPTPTTLGGMTLDQYCVSINQGPSAYLNGQIWSCKGNSQPINLNTACVWQYNISNAYAAETTLGNVYSYTCFAPRTSTTPTPTIVTPTPTPNGTNDWTIYKFDNQRSNFNPNETIINASSASRIKLHWTTNPASPSTLFGPNTISDQPMVVKNVIYYGDWTGSFYAKNINDGTTIWTRNIGVMTPPAVNNCNPKSVGVVGSAAVKSIMINGVQTLTVFIAGANGNMYALNAKDGAILWKTHLVDPNKGELIWDSPAVYNNSIYVGSASEGDCPLGQGKMFKLDLTSGVLQVTTKLVPDGCVGAGEWASPTIDEANNKVYISTGTQDNSCKVNGKAFVEPYALAVVEFDLNLNILGSSRIPLADQRIDSDYGVSPSLTTGTINGVQTQLVSTVNKNGKLYTFKRDHLNDGAIWSKSLGIGGTCPDCGQGSISTAATDGKILYQGSGSTTINGINYKASIRAIDPTTGNFIWEHGLAKALVASPSMVKGILVVPNGNRIDIMTTSNGQELIQLTPPGTGSILDGPITVAQGSLIFGDLNGTFWNYGL